MHQEESQLDKDLMLEKMFFLNGLIILVMPLMLYRLLDQLDGDQLVNGMFKVSVNSQEISYKRMAIMNIKYFMMLIQEGFSS